MIYVLFKKKKKNKIKTFVLRINLYIIGKELLWRRRQECLMSAFNCKDIETTSNNIT